MFFAGHVADTFGVAVFLHADGSQVAQQLAARRRLDGIIEIRYKPEKTTTSW
jgi:hypothetical protein